MVRGQFRAIPARGLTLLCCLSAIGCGDLPDGSTEQKEEALIGGTRVDDLRPEIGKISIAGGWCTATLVDPRYVITASHCVDYQTGPQSGSFQMNGLGNVAVDFAYAFGGGLGTEDIAFARLASPVPSSTATPATFGPLPVSNETVTTFGYGCTTRSDYSTGGFKQFVTHSYGTTVINCKGDSGGPRVRGFSTDNGTIWGINSGWSDWSNEDITADAATNGPSLLRGVRTFGGTTTINPTVADVNGWARASGAKAVGGDFNGDGMGDVALVGGSGWTTIVVAFGNGLGGFTVKNQALSTFPGLANLAAHAVGGDFDGDGDTDIALFGGPASWGLKVPMALSNRDGTFTVKQEYSQNLQSWSQVAGAYPVAGDFDGDGDSDIVLLGGAGWTTFPMGFSNRNGTFSQTNEPDSGGFVSYARTAGPQAVAGDLDGDGDADLALSGRSGWTTIMTAFSNRLGRFTVNNKAVANFPGWAAASGVKIIAGDFDGDGDADVGAVGGNNWRTIAFALSDRTGGFAPANLPIANISGWANAARFALVGRADVGFTSDLILIGGSGWTTMPVALLKP